MINKVLKGYGRGPSQTAESMGGFWVAIPLSYQQKNFQKKFQKIFKIKILLLYLHPMGHNKYCYILTYCKRLTIS